MCGIFAYINYLTPRTRREVLEFLIKGLQRLEYRGYDSAGVAIDGDVIPNVIKQTGKVRRHFLTVIYHLVSKYLQTHVARFMAVNDVTVSWHDYAHYKPIYL